jgi:hypothetical protein
MCAACGAGELLVVDVCVPVDAGGRYWPVTATVTVQDFCELSRRQQRKVGRSIAAAVGQATFLSWESSACSGNGAGRRLLATDTVTANVAFRTEDERATYLTKAAADSSAAQDDLQTALRAELAADSDQALRTAGSTAVVTDISSGDESSDDNVGLALLITGLVLVVIIAAVAAVVLKRRAAASPATTSTADDDAKDTEAAAVGLDDVAVEQGPHIFQVVGLYSFNSTLYLVLFSFISYLARLNHACILCMFCASRQCSCRCCSSRLTSRRFSCWQP